MCLLSFDEVIQALKATDHSLMLKYHNRFKGNQNRAFSCGKFDVSASCNQLWNLKKNNYRKWQQNILKYWQNISTYISLQGNFKSPFTQDLTLHECGVRYYTLLVVSIRLSLHQPVYQTHLKCNWIALSGYVTSFWQRSARYVRSLFRSRNVNQHSLPDAGLITSITKIRSLLSRGVLTFKHRLDNH